MAPADVFIGQLIRKAREHLALNVDDIAEEIGVPSAKLTEFERGLRRPSPSELLSLCAVLRVQPSWFFPEYLGKAEEQAPQPSVGPEVEERQADNGRSTKPHDLAAGDVTYKMVDGQIMIILPNGLRLLMGKDFDEIALRRLLRLLGTGRHFSPDLKG